MVTVTGILAPSQWRLRSDPERPGGGQVGGWARQTRRWVGTTGMRTALVPWALCPGHRRSVVPIQLCSGPRCPCAALSSPAKLWVRRTESRRGSSLWKQFTPRFTMSPVPGREEGGQFPSTVGRRHRRRTLAAGSCRLSAAGRATVP